MAFNDKKWHVKTYIHKSSMKITINNYQLYQYQIEAVFKCLFLDIGSEMKVCNLNWKFVDSKQRIKLEKWK